MNHATIKQEIIKQLDYMPPDMQLRVLDFAKALVPHKLKGVPGKHLLRFAGIMETEDVKAMSRAIEEGCEPGNRRRL